MNDPRTLLDHLLSLPPTEIETWLRTSGAPPDFNWLGLAEVTAHEAMRADATSGISWARVAICIRERIAATAQDDSLRQSQIISAMNLRAAMINRHGPLPGDPLLDCQQIYRWFLNRHPDQIEQVTTDAAHWRELPIARIRELRRIKNELNVLRNLGSCIDVAPPEAQRWIEMWPQLP
ncbi:hypothetical protein ACWIGW_29690 [Nocardia brasiliensis]